MQLAAFLCVICVICGRITRKSTQSIYKEETPMCLSQIPQIIADKPQEPQNPNLSFSAKYAACCIRLRHLRYLRENIHIRVLNQLHKETPVSLADLADYADKTQNHNNITNCLSLRNNAACCILCVICVICGRIFTQEYSINCTKKTQCLSQISQIYADKTHNHKTA